MKVTAAKCLDSTSYFLVPFIDDTLTAKDLMIDTPLFLGTYTANLNNPKLDNHLFLLYKSNIDPTFNKLLEKLQSIPTYCNKQTIRLNGNWYMLLIFKRPVEYNVEITRIIDLRSTDISYDTKVKIISYWQLPVTSNLHKRLFTTVVPPLKIEDTIPEEDLTFSDFELDIFKATA